LIKDKLLSIPHETLLYFLAQPVQTGHTPSMQNNNFYGGNIKFIKTDNLRDNFIKPFFNHYLSEEGNNEIKRTALKKQDIITTIIGATYDVIARSCIINQDVLPANINQNIALLRVDPYKIRPEFLTLYLNSKYGKKYLHYLSRQMEQVNLNCREVEQIIVPMLSNSFQLSLELHFKNGHKNLEESKKSYANAESLLVQSIGLLDFKPSTEAVNIKSFKESFGTSGRLDAEYYQKKYEEVIKHITSQNYATLKDIVSIKKSIEPGSDVYADEGLPFLRVADYNKFGITDPDKKLSYTFCNENAELINKLKPKKETILFSKDGSVGTAYMLRKDEEMITSGAILHLNVRDKKQIIPEYLTLALNSQIVKMQSERDAGGSIILHWRISEIENVVVPIISIEKQKEIAALVEESFRLKKQSEQLLEAAKKAVEVAIEEGEERAMEWMYVNTGI